MSNIIDRRLNAGRKSEVNRQRFIRRFKNQIRKAVEESINKKSIKDVNKGEVINIPAKDTYEPTFKNGKGGYRNIVLPGNKEFITGDKIPRPPAGTGQGNQGEASDKGEGKDDFVFELSREEFMDIFFEDLQLPNLIKTQISKEPSYKYVRAGFTTDGTPTNLNILRTVKGATSRRIAFRKSYSNEIEELEEKLKNLKNNHSDEQEINNIKKEIATLKTKIKNIPFIDPYDLRFSRKEKQMIPTTQAVMFCIMDVSGSMDQNKKDIAKRFFILLYLFLQKNYDHIDLVFIRHHTSAKEVDEQDFFYSRETGGTVVSSALELMVEIMHDRYPTSDWNIYGAQASDGDNWNADSPNCKEILKNRIIPFCQYYAYVEIMPRNHQSLWESYKLIQEVNKNFQMQTIKDPSEIYPVFRELFKRQKAE